MMLINDKPSVTFNLRIIMNLLTDNQLSLIAGGLSESHYDSSFITVYSGECYTSNMLGANLCHNGIYDLQGQLLYPMKPLPTVELNGYEIDITIYTKEYEFSIMPNIIR